MHLFKSGLHRLNNSPYLLLIFPPLFWAGNVVLGRGVNQIIPPITLAFWRWLIALLILIPFTWKRVKKDWGIVRDHWKIFAVLSLLGIACFNTLLYNAVHTTTAINGALIQTSMPAWIVVFSLNMFKERVRFLQVVGVGICLLGAFYTIAHGNLAFITRLSFVVGDIWMIVAVAIYALYSALLRKRPSIDELSFVTVTFAMGCLMLFPLYLWETSVVGGLTLSWTVIASVLYVSLFPSIFAYLCWNRGVELLGANQAGLFINFIPVFASILAIVLLGETFRLFHLVGIILIIGGITLFNRLQVSRRKVSGS